MGRHKGTTCSFKGQALRRSRKAVEATSPLLIELLVLIDADDRAVQTVLSGAVSHVTVSRWRGGLTTSANLRAVERVGAAYGYRLQWVKDDALHKIAPEA